VRTRHWFQPGPNSPRFIGRRADVTRRRLLGISRRRLVVSSRSWVHPGDTRLLALEADAPGIPLGGVLRGRGPAPGENGVCTGYAHAVRRDALRGEGQGIGSRTGRRS
jgi:hypothetical protein